VLISFDRNHVARPMSLMKQVRAQCERLAPVLVILDNAAQLFAGEENMRAEVTQFCNALTSIARDFDCAVLLLGHPAKAEGSEYSGSTGWDAAVRSRLLLERRDDGTSRLSKVKANYSALDELALEWRNGAFIALPPAQGASPETLAAIKPLIVSAIERYTQRQQSTSHVKTTRNYLVKMMKTDQLLGGLAESLVHATLNAMLDAGEVVPNQVLPWKDSTRHAVAGLVNAQEIT
jgi:AAA domain